MVGDDDTKRRGARREEVVAVGDDEAAVANLRSRGRPFAIQLRDGSEDACDVGIVRGVRREGAEVVQLYVQDVQASVPRPLKELKGFEKVSLRAGQAKVVSITLDARAMSFYDVTRKQWTVEPGQFKILIGSSSRDIRVSTEFEVV